MTRSHPPPVDCDAVIDSLVSGARWTGPGADARLSEHVGSCLRCFRTASDLRGLPQLREELERAAAALPDPGPAFWSSFPAQVRAAWDAREGTTAPVVAPVPAFWSVAGRRVRAWLRVPLVAAGAGAFAAAAIALVLVGLRAPLGTPIRPGDSPSKVAEARPSVVGPGAVSIGPGAGLLNGTIDDSIRDLDVRGLALLRDELEQTLADDVPARPPGEAETQVESNPIALSDELDELDAAGLSQLVADLRGPI